jgi:hypothetical protein
MKAEGTSKYHWRNFAVILALLVGLSIAEIVFSGVDLLSVLPFILPMVLIVAGFGYLFVTQRRRGASAAALILGQVVWLAASCGAAMVFFAWLMGVHE